MNPNPLVVAKPRATKPPAKRALPPRIAPATLEKLAQVFKMLADESRLKILLALAQEGELHVAALCRLLGDEQPAQQPAVSHHLTLLRMAGLVGYRRAGKNNFYRLESGLIRDLLEQFFADAGSSHKAFQFEDFSLAFKRK